MMISLIRMVEIMATKIATVSHLPLCPSSQPLTSRAPSTSCSGDYHHQNSDGYDDEDEDDHYDNQDHIIDEEDRDGVY